MLLSILFFVGSFFSTITWTGETTHDFGDMELYSTQSHSFTYINQSDEAVSIDNVRAGCGCTVPDWNKEAVPPGASAEIRVQFSPRQSGFLRKPIKVYFRGQRKAEKLYVVAFVDRKQP